MYNTDTIVIHLDENGKTMSLFWITEFTVHCILWQKNITIHEYLKIFSQFEIQAIWCILVKSQVLTKF